LHAGLVAEPLDRPAADDVRRHDLLQIGLLHAGIPDVLGIDDDHRTVPALGKAAGLVDPHVDVLAGRAHAVLNGLPVPLHVVLRRAGVPARTYEHVMIVLAHWGSFRSAELIAMGAPTWPRYLKAKGATPPSDSPGNARRAPAIPWRPTNFMGAPTWPPRPPTLGAPRQSRGAPRKPASAELIVPDIGRRYAGLSHPH